MFKASASSFGPLGTQSEHKSKPRFRNKAANYVKLTNIGKPPCPGYLPNVPETMLETRAAHISNVAMVLKISRGGGRGAVLRLRVTDNHGASQKGFPPRRPITPMRTSWPSAFATVREAMSLSCERGQISTARFYS